MSSRRALLIALWSTALLTALFSARYFLVPAPWVPPPVPPMFETLTASHVGQVAVNAGRWVYEQHPAWVVTHVACGTVAIAIGLLQFLPALRARRPRFHRRLGWLYVAAVSGGSLSGMFLTYFTYAVIPADLRITFAPLIAGFGTLSITWVGVTAPAIVRARQGRWDEHRAWMTRSYSLTYAAFTVRMAAAVFLPLTTDIALTTNLSILSWPLNLVVAEILLMRNARRSPAIPA
jgi:uncharacterized membrane protein